MTSEPPAENRNGWIFLSIMVIILIIVLIFLMSSMPLMGAASAAPVMNHKTTVTRISAAGDQEWQVKIPGIGDPVKMLPTSDGGSAIYGSFGDPKEIRPALQVVKLDKDGKIEWDYLKGMYGFGFPVSLSYPRILFESDDGYTIFTGSGVVVHLDSQGKDQWFREYPHNSIRNVIVTTDGGYVLAGDTYAYNVKPDNSTVGEYTGIIISLDGSGNLLWENKDPDYQSCGLMSQQSNGTLRVVCSRRSSGASTPIADVRSFSNAGIILSVNKFDSDSDSFPPNADNDPGISFIQKTITNGEIQLVMNSYSPSAKETTIYDQVQPGKLLEVYKVIPAKDGGYLVFSGSKK